LEAKRQRPRYKDKIDLVRDTFPELIKAPPSPKKATITLGIPSREPDHYRSLPYMPFLASLWAADFALLSGSDSSQKQRESGSLPPNSYLRKPENKDDLYRISGVPGATLAAKVPSAISPLLADSSAKPVSYSDQDIRELEVSLRRTVGILNHQHWMTGMGLTKLAEQDAQTPVPDPPKEAAKDLAKAPLKDPVKPVITPLDLFESSQKAGQDALRQVTRSLNNVVLRRRDAVIAALPKDLSAPQKRELRKHTFLSSDLFDPAACTKLHEECSSRNQARDLVREVNRSGSSRSKGQQGQQSQYQRSNSSSGQPKAKDKWDKWEKPYNKRGGGGGGGGGRGQAPKGKGGYNNPSSSASPGSKKGRGGGNRRK
jgi:hypothetical protein